MSRPTIVIHNSQTDEITTREMNESEYKVHLERIAKYEAAQAEAEAKEAQRKAIADRLGLTAEELKVLLG